MQRQRVEQRLLGATGAENGALLFNERVLELDGAQQWRGWLHNSVNVFNATEVYT